MFGYLRLKIQYLLKVNNMSFKDFSKTTQTSKDNATAAEQASAKPMPQQPVPKKTAPSKSAG